MVCVGFVGVEAFDIILYIGKTITVLDYRVLIVDLSKTGAMTRAIYHGMDMDSADDIIHYRNINYIRRVPKDNELKDYRDGVVFVVYGFNYVKNYPIKTDVLCIITDSLPSNIDKINNLKCFEDANRNRINVLVRDIVSMDDFERVKSSIKCPESHADYEYLYYDTYDYENALKCQLLQVIQFRRISSRMRRIIIDKISKLLPDIKPSSVRKAFLRARKGVT